MSDTAESPYKHITTKDAQPNPRWMMVILLAFVLSVSFLLVRSRTISVGGRVTAKAGGSVTLATTVAPTSLPRAQVIVQVANGTSIRGLARTYTQQLQIQGWNTLAEINGPHLGNTVVYYNPGFLADAQAIASELHVSDVQPLGGTAVVPGAVQDDVVVILGPDLANG